MTATAIFGGFLFAIGSFMQTSMTHASGTFDVTITPAPADDHSDGGALGRMTVDKVYHGDLEGRAVAQMLTRIGLKVSLDAMTQSTFFARRNRREFGFWLAGWGSDTGEMSSPLKALIATPNKETGMGATNPGGYSSAAVDATLQKALATVDDAKRGALLAEGSRTAMEDFGAIPLHFEMTTWAFKKDLDYTPRADQFTQGTMVKKGK